MKQRSGMPYDVVAFSTDEKALLLTLEEEGAFHRLLRHAWVNGSVPDDFASLAQICRCPRETMTQMWPRLSEFWRLDGRNRRRTNPKQESERKYLKSKADAGSKGGSNSQAKRKQTSSTDNESAAKQNASPLPSPSQPSPSSNLKDDSLPVDRIPRKRGQAKTLPSYLTITDEMRQFCGGLGVLDAEAETEAMLDHFKAKGEARADWTATWRNWMRNSKRFANNGGHHGHRSKDDINRENAQRLRARMDAQDSGGGFGDPF